MLAAATLPLAASAAPFPSKTVRIFVPNGAGGAADLTARLVAEHLAALVGQAVIIENRPGAGGIVAAAQVAHAEPDGHTLLLVSSGTAVSAALFKSLPFDTRNDFAPVSLLATFDLAIVAKPGGRFSSLNALLAYAQSSPGKLNIGTPQVGTTQNLAAELFKASARIDAQVIPFNGTPPLITALRGGEIDAAIDILGPLMPQISAQTVVPLAVLGSQRAAQLPDVPTASSTGGALARFEVSSWNGLAVPARTPPATIARLNREIQAVLGQPDVRKRLADMNLSAQGSSPAQLAERMAADIQRWSGVIARAKIPRQ